MRAKFLTVALLLFCASGCYANAIKPGFYYGSTSQAILKRILQLIGDADRQIIVHRNGYELPGLSAKGSFFETKEIVSFLKTEKHRGLVVFILHPVEIADRKVVKNDLTKLGKLIKQIDYNHVLVLGGHPDGWEVFQDTTKTLQPPPP